MDEKLIRSIAVPIAAIVLSLGGCASVQKNTVVSWQGKHSQALETDTFFSGLPLIKTQTDEGSDIWHYLESSNSDDCLSRVSTTGFYSNQTNYKFFARCLRSKDSCSHIFLVKRGLITKYETSVSGKAVCSRKHQ